MFMREFFNPNDRLHLMAYQTLQRTGVWPKPFFDAFIAAGGVVESCWQQHLMGIMADKWVEHELDDRCDDELRATISELESKLAFMEKDSTFTRMNEQRQAMITRALAAEDALRCTTCGGEPPASGVPCICGGTNDIRDEVQGLHETVTEMLATIARYDSIMQDDTQQIQELKTKHCRCVFDAWTIANRDAPPTIECAYHQQQRDELARLREALRRTVAWMQDHGEDEIGPHAQECNAWGGSPCDCDRDVLLTRLLQCL